jgi:pyruvate/2-oxoglutarate/acetoin dehydrogenase E1 component
VPLVVRAACGGGYGDGGQHEQILGGLLATIPGLRVVLPSNPADAAGLMRSAIDHDDPVVFLEHKLLAAAWLDWMGGTSRPTVEIPVPATGAVGPVPDPIEAIPLGSAAERRVGSDIALVSLEAADELAAQGTDCTVLDLRTISPLDTDALVHVAERCRRVLVVDEDYKHFGLSGEVAAQLAETTRGVSFARLAVTDTLPYARRLEAAALPSVAKIVAATKELDPLP